MIFRVELKIVPAVWVILPELSESVVVPVSEVPKLPPIISASDVTDVTPKSTLVAFSAPETVICPPEL